MLDDDRPIVKTTEEARGGRELNVMRYVLAISLVAAIIIVGGIALYFRFAT